MITTVDQANIELEAAIADMRSEFGEEVDDCVADLVEGVAYNIENDEVAREFCRTQLGYVPLILEGRLGRIDWLDS